jgi:hypothetical protein
MPTRFRTSILFAFVLVVLYLLFLFDSKDVRYKNVNPVAGLGGAGTETVAGSDKGEDVKETPAAGSRPSASVVPPPGGSVTQKEFDQEFDALGL